MAGDVTTLFDLVLPDGRRFPCRLDGPMDGVYYMLEDGNYSCDCNRTQLIADQHGVKLTPDAPWDVLCGETIRMENLRLAGGVA